MSEVEIADSPAPESEVTATPEIVNETPESQPTKTFTQEELDAAISKRLAREQRKWERMQAQTTVPPSAPAEVPSADQFSTVDAYADALATRKAEELVSQRENQRQQAQVLEQYHDREEKARDKYTDFEQVAYNPNLPITTVMAQTIQASDVGPDVAYYLGANPKEAERISRLAPFMQAKEIGRIEAKVADAPPVRRTTNAPAPIAPVTPKGSSAPVHDTTDPRSIKSMTTSEWIAAERQRQVKKWEAQRNR
jgi:hypothetical protein